MQTAGCLWSNPLLPNHVLTQNHVLLLLCISGFGLPGTSANFQLQSKSYNDIAYISGLASDQINFTVPQLTDSVPPYVTLASLLLPVLLGMSTGACGVAVLLAPGEQTIACLCLHIYCILTAPVTVYSPPVVDMTQLAVAL